MRSSLSKLAAAKVNLALHVVGQRDDGYHLLESLVIFADFGDRITVTIADEDRSMGDHHLSITGPFAAGLETGPDNLVMRATHLMGPDLPALDIVLEKNLPVASGIGGGSADAAATMSAISELLERPLPSDEGVLSLGADVPVCLFGKPSLMTGIGEELASLTLPSALALLLVNPGVEVSTPQIFKTLEKKNNEALPSFSQAAMGNKRSFCQHLHTCRNDLQPPAIFLQPVIGECLNALATAENVLLHRMSGSGATCFALFDTLEAAQSAETEIKQNHSDWWCAAGLIQT